MIIRLQTELPKSVERFDAKLLVKNARKGNFMLALFKFSRALSYPVNARQQATCLEHAMVTS
ncbi:hypothetical protein [Dyella sp.]|uniref:hypothetical protein n=1 Tax=Dyella sp. TaxID=1869338 RepID=UPI002ECFE831